MTILSQYIVAPTNIPRRPSAGWGLSRQPIKRGAMRRDAIGSSLRWSDGEVADHTKAIRT
jgi:hypothetical protein